MSAAHEIALEQAHAERPGPFYPYRPHGAIHAGAERKPAATKGEKR